MKKSYSKVEQEFIEYIIDTYGKKDAKVKNFKKIYLRQQRLCYQSILLTKIKIDDTRRKEFYLSKRRVR